MYFQQPASLQLSTMICFKEDWGFYLVWTWQRSPWGLYQERCMPSLQAQLWLSCTAEIRMGIMMETAAVIGFQELPLPLWMAWLSSGPRWLSERESALFHILIEGNEWCVTSILLPTISVQYRRPHSTGFRWKHNLPWKILIALCYWFLLSDPHWETKSSF